MLVIRLFRVGKKNQPSFKIVVTDKKNPPRGGRFVEQVGFWNPLKKEKVLKQDRIKYWLSVGAKTSPTVHNMLVSEKIIDAKKIPKHKVSKEVKQPAEQAATTEQQPESKTEQQPQQETKPESQPETAPTSEPIPKSE